MGFGVVSERFDDLLLDPWITFRGGNTVELEAPGQDVDERAVRGGDVVGERPALEPTYLVADLLSQFGREPRLAQPGFTLDRKKATPTGLEIVEGGEPGGALRLSADHR